MHSCNYHFPQHILEIVIAQIQFAHYLSFIFVYLIYVFVAAQFELLIEFTAFLFLID